MGGAIGVVVGGFAGDDDVVDVASRRPALEMRMKRAFCLQLFDGGAAEVAHAGAQAADELVDHGFERAAVRDAAFDAFGDELGEAVLAAGASRAVTVAALGARRLGHVLAALEVALAGALRHGGRASPCRGRP